MNNINESQGTSMPLIYLVKIGNNTLEYDYLTNSSSLLVINNTLRDNYPISLYPRLNNNSIMLLRYSGGTIVYRETNPEKFVWLINLNHNTRNQYYVSEMNEKILNIINDVKIDMRDVKISKIV